MKNKGQALIEFIIILPVLLLLVLGAIDVGNMLYKKYTLENDLDYVTDLVRQGKNVEANYYVKQKNISYSVEEKNNTITVTLTKKVEILTPGLNKILGNPYLVQTSRVIANE